MTYFSIISMAIFIIISYTSVIGFIGLCWYILWHKFLSNFKLIQDICGMNQNRNRTIEELRLARAHQTRRTRRD